MGLFGRGIDTESGIVFPEGWFRSGIRPATGHPLAEIYAISGKDDPVESWELVEQERLSRTPRWGDDYFQIWAEVLAVSGIECAIVRGSWVIVVFDRDGTPATRVDYWPIYRDGKVTDVAYADATSSLERVRWSH